MMSLQMIENSKNNYQIHLSKIIIKNNNKNNKIKIIILIIINLEILEYKINKNL